LKLTSLALITLLVLGCGAAFGQTFSLGFLSYTGGLQYCDYETVVHNTYYAAGTHNLTTFCGLPVNGVMVGFPAALAVASGSKVTGKVVEMADNTFDAESEAYTGCQLDWVSQLVASKINLKHPKYGWTYFYTCGSNLDYAGNYGFLSTTLDSRNNHSNKMAVKR